MKKVYQIAETQDRKALLEFLVQHGQELLPFVELIAEAQLAVDEFIEVLGRASLEAVLQLSAGTVAGPPHQGQTGERFTGTAASRGWCACRRSGCG